MSTGSQDCWPGKKDVYYENPGEGIDISAPTVEYCTVKSKGIGVSLSFKMHGKLEITINYRKSKLLQLLLHS